MRAVTKIILFFTLIVSQQSIAQSITLDVQNNATGFADLSWTIPSSITSGTFFIYKDIVNSGFGFQLLTSVNYPEDNYSDEIFICESSQINYEIRYTFSNGTQINSNIDGTVFVDIKAPSEVSFLNLTVSDVNEATLTWVQSTESDIDSYRVLRYNKNTQGWDLIFIKNDPDISHIDNPIGTTIESQLYRVLPVDKCNNVGSSVNYSSTIFLESTYNQCDLSISFNWNPYIIGQSGNNVIDESLSIEIATKYELLVSIDAGVNFNPLQSVNKGTHTTTQNNVPIDVELCYKIQATLPSGEISVSNIVCQFTEQPLVSTENYIKNTTVVDDESVQLDFHVSGIYSDNKIDLYKSENGNSFNFVEELNSNTKSYLDSEVDVEKSTYDYYFEIKDGCDNVREVSNYSNSILLKVVYDEYENFPILKWNPYSDYQKGVEKYQITRYVNNQVSFIDTVPSSQNFYNDTLLQVQMSSYSTLCYTVSAVEADTNSFGYKEESLSNSFCLDDKTTVYIPTGFIIGGRSGLFKPIFTYVTDEDYRFLIYNRWGQVIFETTNPYEGWDGSYKDNIVQVGTYAYKLFYKDDLNEKKYLAGSVTVIR